MSSHDLETSNRFHVLQDEFTDENEAEFPDRERTTFFASQRSRNEREKLNENEVESPDRERTGFFATQRSRNESEKPSENEVEFPDRERTGFFASQRSRNERQKPSVIITGDSIIKNLDPRQMSR